MGHADTSGLRLLCPALLAIGMAVPPAAGQSVSGTILGTVTDSSGAVVLGRQGDDPQRRHRAHADDHLGCQR